MDSMRGRRFAPVTVLALVLASGGLADATETPAFALVDTARLIITFDPSGKPVGGCYVEMREALAAATEYVRDPDDLSYTNSHALYIPSCRICYLKAEIKRVEHLKQAAARIRDVLARCP